ncbi:MAG TPA: hypothetical protein VGZ26_11325 [Pirellulales bacterium]|jgi:hypothetical protein|nr:hypothetical protein [Pirellulales bacterium]
MSQATRVYSTPPINTPVDPTRRHLLTIPAGGAIAAVVGIPTSTTAPAVDPAFALIAAKLAADVAHCKAIDAQGEIEGRGDFRSDAAIEAQDNAQAACHFANEVDWKLATTPPTTLAGVAAVLRLANEIEDAGNEWPNTDTVGRDGWHYQLRATIAQAIETIISEGRS